MDVGPSRAVDDETPDMWVQGYYTAVAKDTWKSLPRNGTTGAYYSDGTECGECRCLAANGAAPMHIVWFHTFQQLGGLCYVSAKYVDDGACPPLLDRKCVSPIQRTAAPSRHPSGRPCRPRSHFRAAQSMQTPPWPRGGNGRRVPALNGCWWCNPPPNTRAHLQALLQ